MRGSTMVRRMLATVATVALAVTVGTTPTAAAAGPEPAATRSATGGQLLTRSATDTAPPPVRTIVGTVAVGDRYPYVFTIGTDGNLWINWQDQTQGWNWSNMGTPPGVGIRMPVGVTIVDAFSRPYAFVLGTDGNLWSLWRSLTAWQWRNQGAPPGSNFVSWPSFAAVAVDGTSPYIFVRSDGDETIWVNRWNGAVWSWANLGSPPDGISAYGPLGVLLEEGTPQVYVVGNYGHLWSTRVDGQAAIWNDLGNPGVSLDSGSNALGAQNAIQVAPNARPYLFALGSDRNAWIRWRSEAGWQWHNLGSPPGQTLVSAPLGVLSVDGTSPFSFHRTGEGGLWINYWDGSNWYWSDQNPPFQPAGGGSAVVAPQNSSRPALFLLDTGGNLWSRWWDGSWWNWTNRSAT
ncbi:hypothetical protein [Micromonospora rifamycinica]|uniref:Uncharacterized protein n=1 Tax=Micromonospora rifamycinica TaxID=291594 RepID=A0A1C5H1Y1_9ACTN|nr:hypothetical protein [Micromonospora rifamycinica]SCG39837.1 hypothetical protein GA0070623_0594 [Micromonospora rifamycinica]